MDLGPLSLPGPSAGSCLCPCACPFCCRPASPSFRRSMKRRFEPDSADGGGGEVAARVEGDDELEALREAVANQQETIQELCAELDEERNAAIISMRTEKAQLVLLREFAHQLHKDLSPEKKIVKKKIFNRKFLSFCCA